MRRKLLYSFFGFLSLFFLIFPFTNPKDVFADTDTGTTCESLGYSVNYNFTPPLTNDKTSITVTINHGGSLPDGTYALKVSNTNECRGGRCGGSITEVASSGNTLTFNNVTTSEGRFREGGNAKITLMTAGGDAREAICSEEFKVIAPEERAPDAGGCSINFSTDFKPNSGIKFNVQNLQGDDGSTRGVVVYETDNKGSRTANDIVNGCKSNSELRSSDGIQLANPKLGGNGWPAGYYAVKVTRNCTLWDSSDGPEICGSPAFIRIHPDNGGVMSFSQPDFDPGKTRLACIEKGSQFECNTAIGTIRTSPDNFLQAVLRLFLAVAGAILLLLIIINGYKFMTSQGDPEKIKDAREGIIAAIAGILLIIFSLAILRLITVDILGIPGFG